MEIVFLIIENFVGTGNILLTILKVDWWSKIQALQHCIPKALIPSLTLLIHNSGCTDKPYIIPAPGMSSLYCQI